MNILIGCEESGIVAKAFRKAGHEAYSCDIKPSRGNNNIHILGDIKEHLRSVSDGFYDLIVLHPDCTAMAVSGNRWYGKGMPQHEKRKHAIRWTTDLWELAKKKGKRVALENPVSVIFKYLPNVFYLQPWEHGHGETKKTGFALHELEPLKPTNVVEGREQRIWKMPPGANRKRDRSETFAGVAAAIVEQWGIY